MWRSGDNLQGSILSYHIRSVYPPQGVRLDISLSFPLSLPSPFPSPTSPLLSSLSLISSLHGPGAGTQGLTHARQAPLSLRSSPVLPQCCFCVTPKEGCGPINTVGSKLCSIGEDGSFGIRRIMRRDWNAAFKRELYKSNERKQCLRDHKKLLSASWKAKNFFFF